jgi:hypothetical protein
MTTTKAIYRHTSVWRCTHLGDSLSTYSIKGEIYYIEWGCKEIMLHLDNACIIVGTRGLPIFVSIMSYSFRWIESYSYLLPGLGRGFIAIYIAIAWCMTNKYLTLGMFFLFASQFFVRTAVYLLNTHVSYHLLISCFVIM